MDETKRDEELARDWGREAFAKAQLAKRRMGGYGGRAVRDATTGDFVAPERPAGLYERGPETYPIASWAAAMRGEIGNASLTGAGIAAHEQGAAERARQAGHLPLKGTSTPEDRAALERVGFTLGEPGRDPLFRAATFPAGWRFVAEPTDGRHSTLVDERGRTRGGMSHFPSHYDAYATFALLGRFAVEEWPGATTEAWDWQSDTRRAVALDRVTGERKAATILFATAAYERGPGDYTAAERRKAAAQAEAEAWLTAQRPDWRDRAAYWDE